MLFFLKGIRSGNFSLKVHHGGKIMKMGNKNMYEVGNVDHYDGCNVDKFRF